VKETRLRKRNIAYFLSYVESRLKKKNRKGAIWEGEGHQLEGRRGDRKG
jgi:hypothetical protein